MRIENDGGNRIGNRGEPCLGVWLWWKFPQALEGARLVSQRTNSGFQDFCEWTFVIFVPLSCVGDNCTGRNPMHLPVDGDAVLQPMENATFELTRICWGMWRQSGMKVKEAALVGFLPIAPSSMLGGDNGWQAPHFHGPVSVAQHRLRATVFGKKQGVK